MQRRRCRKNRTAAARHPYLGERARYRAGVGAAATFVKKMVGTPRRRGPKIQARMRRFSDAKAALPRKSDGGGAPSLPCGNERATAREREEAAVSLFVACFMAVISYSTQAPF